MHLNRLRNYRDFHTRLLRNLRQMSYLSRHDIGSGPSPPHGLLGQQKEETSRCIFKYLLPSDSGIDRSLNISRRTSLDGRRKHLSRVVAYLQQSRWYSRGEMTDRSGGFIERPKFVLPTPHSDTRQRAH